MKFLLQQNPVITNYMYILWNYQFVVKRFDCIYMCVCVCVCVCVLYNSSLLVVYNAIDNAGPRGLRTSNTSWQRSNDSIGLDAL